MTSCDTNILFPACDVGAAGHVKARAFLEDYKDRDDFCIGEQVLLELYCLLRNPTVCRNSLSGPDAVAIIQTLRSNPMWRVVDVVMNSNIMEQVWSHGAGNTFAYRRIFDARLAVTLRHHGVTQFATRNKKDFVDFAFTRVWDPLA